MTLYELTTNLLELKELLVNGYIDGETHADTLESLQFDTEQKLEGYAQLIRQLEAEAAAHKMESDWHTARRTARENAAERLKDRVAAHLAATGQESANAGLFKWKLNPPSTEIIDKELIPATFAVEKVTTTYPLSPIKNAILAGEDVPGARLVRKAGLK